MNSNRRFESSSLSLYSDRIPSPISLPQARLSQYTPPETHQAPHDSPSDVCPSPAPESKPRIPRPPNAFMLFRSDLLKKKKAIPQTAERRQQQLSKVAGECWNLLPPGEKQYWHDEAARQMKAHQLKYPDYKFTPAARGSRKAKDKDAATEKHRIRELREKWTQIYGPAVPPTRLRKQQHKEHGLPRYEPDLESDTALNSVPSSSTSSFPPSPSSSISDVSLPPTFPDPSYPHFPDNQLHDYSSNFINGNTYHRSCSACSSPSSFDISSAQASSASSCEATSYSFDANNFSVYPTSFGLQYRVPSSESSPPYELAYPAPPSPSSDGLSTSFNNFNITSPENNVHSPAPNPLRQLPSFTRLNNGKGSSEPPFLSPLVPPTDLNGHMLEQNALEFSASRSYCTDLSAPFPHNYEQLDPVSYGIDPSVINEGLYGHQGWY